LTQISKDEGELSFRILKGITMVKWMGRARPCEGDNQNNIKETPRECVSDPK